MKSVMGFVSVREFEEGIPNLVVTAYDAGGAPEILRKNAPTAEVMKHLGRRISSVLTDAQGSFAFTPEELEFSGNEPRPDLVLVVSAPEDVDDPDHPYPKPPEQRVLYMSVHPRVDAGAREAFPIRLSRAVVERHGVAPVTRRTSAGLDRDWETQDALQERLAQRSVQEVSRRTKARETAVKETRMLNAVPLHLRKTPNLVVGKAALSEEVKSTVVNPNGTKMTALEHHQHSAMLEALKGWKTKGWAPTMRLYLNKAQMDALKIGQQSGTLPQNADINDIMLKLTGGVDLIRKKQPTAVSPEELEAKYLK